MSARFDFTPARLKALADLEAKGLRLPEIARELGCGVHTLIRHKRRTGRINPVKSRAGKLAMAARYGREQHP